MMSSCPIIATLSANSIDFLLQISFAPSSTNDSRVSLVQNHVFIYAISNKLVKNGSNNYVNQDQLCQNTFIGWLILVKGDKHGNFLTLKSNYLCYRRLILGKLHLLGKVFSNLISAMLQRNIIQASGSCNLKPGFFIFRSGLLTSTQKSRK